MTEYWVWLDTRARDKTSTSIIEIRKAIMKQPKSYIGYYIFYGNKIGARMFWKNNEWVYRDYSKGKTYIVKKDGNICCPTPTPYGWY